MPLKKPGPNPNHKWADIWFKEKALKHVVFKMQLDPLSVSPDDQTLAADDDFRAIDPTSLLSDSLLLRIFSLLPSSQYLPNSLVCKRWLALNGRLRRSLKLLDWHFLDSGSLTSRFPDLTEIDLVAASVHSQSPRRSSGIFLTLPFLSIPIQSDDSAARFVPDELFLPPDYIDIGLRTLSRGCPNLRKLALIAGTEAGLASIAAECPTLQELELHRCTNDVLSAIASFENLQILRVIAFVEGLYDDSSISDVGLTILAHGCRRLVKLELSGCEGSYDGISAIGACCPMLEELTLCDHRMDGGWLAALSFCGNLKTLRLEGCKRVDADPGQVEHLGLCPALETLQLRRCQLRDKESLSALFIVCATVREIIFQNCWGLDNDMFSIASICRRVKFLSLEGCSLLTTAGLETVLLSWMELERLRVVSCNNIQDNEVSAALSSLFSVLKEFKWQPDSRSVLASSLAGTGMRTKGGRFFKS
ncbi:hypothetical protein MRB53_019207 [Persea americana]|uniref:Uncharacterized protein n=1 Tax=Persea americana TaxID=3435 RepID=A0ACC2KXU6_PERAE|nr:hypothetical protein MRB53_019207 [Persea americana]